ncbi:MAG: cation diffusion facilitator family transporter [Deltaproteobacteria bacterium]|nr:cation diffusion facilitator family transporter [Deltaproteobacteria bacterium]
MIQNRSQSIRRVLWVVLWLNVVVAVAKLSVGWSIQSLAMMADGLHSLLDGSSNVIGLVGVFLAGRPPDEDHPYGHHKYEAFSALAISFLLGITAIEVAQMGVERLRSAVPVQTSLPAMGVMVATMIANLFITRYESAKGAALKSEVLLADAEHTRSDVYVSLSVLAGLGASFYGWFWADVLVAFGIAGLILYISFGILRRTSSILTDSSVLHPDRVAAVAKTVPEVISCSNIRSRGMSPYLYVDMEIQIDPDLPLWKAHRIAHEVMERCKQELDALDVVVHVEPPSIAPGEPARPVSGMTFGKPDLPDDPTREPS